MKQYLYLIAILTVTLAILISIVNEQFSLNETLTNEFEKVRIK